MRKLKNKEENKENIVNINDKAMECIKHNFIEIAVVIMLIINLIVYRASMESIVFTFIVIGYSYCSYNIGYAIIAETISTVITLIYYITSCNSVLNAITATGLILPLNLVGLIELVILRHKIFKEPKKINWIYKLLLYSTMFSLFVFIYTDNNYLRMITNPQLKVLVVAQSILPIYLMFGIITMTDINKYILIVYNIIYLGSLIVLINSGYAVGENIINLLQLTVVTGGALIKFFGIKRGSYEQFKK